MWTSGLRWTAIVILSGTAGAAIDDSPGGPPPAAAAPRVIDGPMMVEFGPGRFTELLRPDVLRRDARLVAEHLDLDGPQRAIVEALLDDYVQAFDDAAGPLREAVRRSAPPLPQFAVGPGGPEGLIGDLQQIVGDRLPAAPPGAGDQDDVMIWEGADGQRNVRIITAGAGDGPPPTLAEAPELEGAAEGTVSQSVEVRAQPGAEPRVAVRLVARGPDGQSLIPPEVLEKIANQIRERVEQRLREQLARRAGQPLANPDERKPELTTEEIAGMARDFLARKVGLRDQLVADLQMLLTPTQLSFWSTFEQALRRQQSINRSRLSGEYLDLRQLIAQTSPGAIDPATLDQLLRDHEQQLHALLEVRDDFLQRSEIDAFLAARGHDAARRLELARQEQALRVAVRSAHETAADTLALAMAEETQAAAFRQRVLAAAHKRVYQPTRAQRAFKDALDLDDLAAEARQAVAALQQSYLAELEPANERLAQSVHEHEPGQRIRMIEFMARIHEQGHGSHQLPQDPVTDAFAARSKIGLRYLEQLRSHLTPEQLAKVPAAQAPTLDFPGGHVVRTSSSEAGR